MLALMPAAVLIFLGLGALAVDSALAFLGERSAANAAAAAANDAAGVAVDRDAFYADGSVRLDPVLAREVASASVAAAGLEHVEGVTVEVSVAPGAPEVTVTVRGRVAYLFWPGEVEVAASAVATAEE